MYQLPFKAGYFAGKSLQLLAQLLRQKQVSACDLANYTLQEIERLNPLLNAFVFTDRQRVLQQAKQADDWLAQGVDLGPLHGIPIAIKDNIDTFDMPATCGSAHFSLRQPGRDALCVSRLRKAGAIIAGKTLSHEFAFGPTGDRSLQGASRNPYDTSCMTGGSSAGNAAAIAAGMIPAALGTDTGGSIRIPSAFCGICGFKPGWNSTLMQGIFPVSTTLDHVGPMANNIADIATLFSALTHCHVPVNIDIPKPLRVAWLTADSLPVDAVVTRYAQEKVEALLGYLPTTLDISELVLRMHHAFSCIQRAEVLAVHQQRLAHHPELFDDEVRERLQACTQVQGWEYVHALKEKNRIHAELQALFCRYDWLCLPTLPVTAPAVNCRQVEINGQQVTTREAVLSCTSLWNLAGNPAITLPAGQINRLPVGLQIVAPWQRDQQLLAVLRQLICCD